jgi:tetratricopeptide (TPR) repeat protein
MEKHPMPFPTRMILALAGGLVVAGCATQGGPAPSTARAEDAPNEAVDESARNQRLAERAKEREKLPKQQLTGEVLYHLLMAEIGGQRGAAGQSVQHLLRAARLTRDPRVARRATEAALYERDNEQALQGALLWAETDKESAQAKQTVIGLLVALNRVDDAIPHVAALIEGDGSDIAQGFLQLNRLLARNRDKMANLVVIQRLAGRHPLLAEARAAVAQAALNAEKDDLALSEAREARRLKPAWEFPPLFASQVLQKKSVPDAITELRGWLKDYPANREGRTQLARLLIADKQFDAAREEFTRIEKDHPNNADALYALGVLAAQSNDSKSAERFFTKLLATDFRDRDRIHLFLGQYAEEAKRWDDALRHYKSVGRGEMYIDAQLRVAQVIARQGDLTGARAHLAAVPTTTNQQRVQLAQAEAALLREAKLYRETFEMLGRVIDRLPNFPDLMYDYAMAAEKVDRMDIMETYIKRLIVARPDNAHAYNALGYSLADRNQRLEEAKGLIEKALALAPEDAFIIDSMGWVFFRMGDTARALELLQRAYKLRPDADIGAHLGEVLWVMGNKSEARRIWREALSKAPDNDTLRTTMRRLDP